MDYRIEKDTMGEVKVPADKFWGAQTQRGKENFKIGSEKMPQRVVKAFAILKRSTAIANERLGNLESEKAQAIAAVCDDVLNGKYDDNFPLVVWQTGSGTQSNMNMNEVVANRATALLKEKIPSLRFIRMMTLTAPKAQTIHSRRRCTLRRFLPYMSVLFRRLISRARRLMKKRKLIRIL